MIAYDIDYLHTFKRNAHDMKLHWTHAQQHHTFDFIPVSHSFPNQVKHVVISTQ